MAAILVPGIVARSLPGAGVRPRVLAVRRRRSGVVTLFGRGELLEFPPVKEDATAALALLDGNATPINGMHAVLALGTDHSLSLRTARRLRPGRDQPGGLVTAGSGRNGPVWRRGRRAGLS